MLKLTLACLIGVTTSLGRLPRIARSPGGPGLALMVLPDPVAPGPAA